MILSVRELIDELEKCDMDKTVEIVARTILTPEQQMEMLQKGIYKGCIGGTIRNVTEEDHFVIIYATDS